MRPKKKKEENKLFGCDDTERKKEYLNRIAELRDLIIKSQCDGILDFKGKERYELSKQMASKPYVLWQLDFARVFREKGGFDIVIGNPPYIGEEGHKELFQEVANTNFGKKYYTGKMDFWYFFTSKGMEILRKNGCISFIAPNNWMTTAGGKNMRKHIATDGKILKFITFNNVMIFETASQQTMIFFIEKKKMERTYTLKYKSVGNRNMNADELSQFLASDSIGDHYQSTLNPVENADGRTIQILNTSISNVTDKIKA